MDGQAGNPRKDFSMTLAFSNSHLLLSLHEVTLVLTLRAFIHVAKRMRS